MQDKEFAAILQDEPMQPLALVALTEEEQVGHKRTVTPANAERSELAVCSVTALPTSIVERAVLLINEYGCELAFLTFLPFSLFPFSLQRNFSMSVNSVAVLRLMGKGVGAPAPAGVARGRGAPRGGRGKN